MNEALDVQNMRDVAMLDETTDFYQVATKNLEELKALNAPVEIIDTLKKALAYVQYLLQHTVYDPQAHRKLINAWVSAQNWLNDHRGDSK